LTLIAAFFVSCDDEIVRELSPEVNPSTNKVYFPDQDYKLTLGIDAKTFDIKIAREISNEPLTVALKFSGPYVGKFEVPAEVSFAAGESEKTVAVTVGDVELMKNYQFSIFVDDNNQIDPYVTKTNYHVLALNVLKEDFTPYAKGTFNDPFWSEVSTWQQILEYSPSQSLYRMKSLFDGSGESVLFKWDGANVITIQKGSAPSIADYLAGYSTGFYSTANSSYVYAFFLNDQTMTKGGSSLAYNATTKTFSFPIFWGIASGAGWGWKVSTFKIETKY
jgi:hypothetical protein